MCKQSVSNINEKLRDALRSYKEITALPEFEGDSKLFGASLSLKRYLDDLIAIAVVDNDYLLQATFDEGTVRTLDKMNYWLVIANFRKTNSIIVI